MFVQEIEFHAYVCVPVQMEAFYPEKYLSGTIYRILMEFKKCVQMKITETLAVSNINKKSRWRYLCLSRRHNNVGEFWTIVKVSLLRNKVQVGEVLVQLAVEQTQVPGKLFRAVTSEIKFVTIYEILEVWWLRWQGRRLRTDRPWVQTQARKSWKKYFLLFLVGGLVRPTSKYLSYCCNWT